MELMNFRTSIKSYDYRHQYYIYWLSLVRTLGKNNIVRTEDVLIQRCKIVEWCCGTLLNDSWSESNVSELFKGSFPGYTVSVPNAFCFMYSQDALAFKLKFGL